MTEKLGTLKSIANSGITGLLTDQETNTDVEFVDPKLPERKIVVGEGVVFIAIVTPSGRTVAVEVRKPTEN